MRGKPSRPAPLFPPARITPAGAGKTAQAVSGAISHGDHPRRCGENFSFATSAMIASGSPPQVRGKPARICVFFGTHGITPAGAGKTLSIRHPAGAGRDHPRRCGENMLKKETMTAQEGSPPQVRGKQKGRSCCCALARITPAGAGKTR